MLRTLNPAPLEILITADGCTDETVEMLKAEMVEDGRWKMEDGSYRSEDGSQKGSDIEKPKCEMGNVKLIVNEVGKGSVASRDRMMREARGDLVLALDDDSYPEQPDCLHLLSSIFIFAPRWLSPLFRSARMNIRKPSRRQILARSDLTRSFANSGAVLRRSTYLQLPGFEPKFFHMYEEPDYALQCVAAGYEVLFTPLVTIRHHYSGAARSELRNHHRHSRNECWSTMMRCPMPQMPLLALYRVLSNLVMPETGDKLGRSRAGLVVAGFGWHQILPPQSSPRSLVKIQRVVEAAVARARRWKMEDGRWGRKANAEKLKFGNNKHRTSNAATEHSKMSARTE